MLGFLDAIVLVGKKKKKKALPGFPPVLSLSPPPLHSYVATQDLGRNPDVLEAPAWPSALPSLIKSYFREIFFFLLRETKYIHPLLSV